MRRRTTRSNGNSRGSPGRIWGVLLLVLAASLGGCGKKAGIVFPPRANGPMWPPPPDTPRIFYVGSLVTSADLKPEVKGLDAMGQALFGKKDVHSMLSPVSVCTDGPTVVAPGRESGRIFVADSNAQAVHVFDLKTRQYRLWTPPKGQPPLGQPVGIAWDSARQRVLVADSIGSCVVMFNRNGSYAGRLGEGVLQRPVGIAADRGGRILVSDTKLHQVIVFTGDGEVSQRLGSRGAGEGQFNYPTYLSLDPEGRLYVSDSLNFRVQQFDAELRFARAFGRKGDMPGYFAQPKGIATDMEGHVYVVDAQFENVQVFDSQGRVLMDFGEEGYRAGEFWLPVGVWIDAANRIWVADSYNRRIQVFDYRSVPEPATEIQP